MRLTVFIKILLFRIKEIRERLSQLAEEIRQLDSDIEENQGHLTGTILFI